MTQEPSRELANYHKLHVEVTKVADDELLKHLQDTVLGTPGGLQYKHTTVGKKLAHIHDIYFMLLKKSGHLLGSVGLLVRQTKTGQTLYKSWYVRYFSIRAPLRARKYHPSTAMKEASGSVGLLKSVAGHFFETPSLLEPENERSDKPSFMYAYIEDENFRSMRFGLDMGMNPCRQFTTVMFSRFRLKENARVMRAPGNKKRELLLKLEDFYRDYTMFSAENLFVDDNYFVYVEEGEIKAGLQVHPDAWKITGRQGLSGKFLLNIVPRIPGIRKIFDPKHFRFLAIEGIWYKEGCEELLEPLITSVCATFKTHVAMMWFDTRSRLYTTFTQQVNTGFFGRMVKPTEAEIMVRFYGFSEEMIEEFKSRPAYLSAYDMI